MSRTAVYNTVKGVVGDDVNVYGSRAADTPEGDRFVIIVWGVNDVAFANIGPTTVDIYFYDADRDFGWIDKTMQDVRDAFAAAVHVPGDGDILTCARWRGSSADFYDSDYEKVGRSDTYEVVSRTSTSG